VIWFCQSISCCKLVWFTNVPGSIDVILWLLRWHDVAEVGQLNGASVIFVLLSSTARLVVVNHSQIIPQISVSRFFFVVMGGIYYNKYKNIIFML
jgi:hypothetical protein